MREFTKRSIAIVLLGGALFTGACGEEEPDLETPYQPVNNGAQDSSLPASDAATGGSQLDASAAIPQNDAAAVTPGTDASSDVDASGDAGGTAATGCCPDGNCLCRGEAPSALTMGDGPYKSTSYDVPGAGLVFYPTDAAPPFAAVALADGLGGSGGARGQTATWGPFYASHGIVAMIVTTGSGDQPPVRGMKLGGAIAAFKAENQKSGSPLFGKLAGRYGTSGYSMGGGGTTHAASSDPTLKTSIGLAAWSPIGRNVMVPTLFVCGATDGTAPCSMSSGAYGQMPAATPKMWVEVTGGHGAFGRPTAGGGRAGSYALAFQKVFLEGDLRWRPLLVAAESDATNIQ